KRKLIFIRFVVCFNIDARSAWSWITRGSAIGINFNQLFFILFDGSFLSILVFCYIPYFFGLEGYVQNYVQVYHFGSVLRYPRPVLSVLWLCRAESYRRFLSGRSLRTFHTFYFSFTHYNGCNQKECLYNNYTSIYIVSSERYIKLPLPSIKFSLAETFCSPY